MIAHAGQPHRHLADRAVSAAAPRQPLPSWADRADHEPTTPVEHPWGVAMHLLSLDATDEQPSTLELDWGLCTDEDDPQITSGAPGLPPPPVDRTTQADPAALAAHIAARADSIAQVDHAAPAKLFPARPPDLSPGSTLY